MARARIQLTEGAGFAYTIPTGFSDTFTGSAIDNNVNNTSDFVVSGDLYQTNHGDTRNPDSTGYSSITWTP